MGAGHNAIGAIQQSAAQSVAAMDNALVEVNTATEFASQSGAALRDIVSNVEATADQVNAIATASEEQSAASDEINLSIEHVNEMAKQTATAMAEAAKARGVAAVHCQTAEEVLQYVRQFVRPGDAVLVKASHSMGLEQLLQEYPLLPTKKIKYWYAYSKEALWMD